MEKREVEIGNLIYTNIINLIKHNGVSKSIFAKRINKTPQSLNKILYDLKRGNISLKNLTLISDELNVDISDLFQCDINLYNYRTKEI